MNGKALYYLAGVTRSYGASPVLAVDRLEIKPGEVLALVGPTGAGKSTLLRLLAGVDRPTGGTVMFAEHHNGGEWPLELRRRVTLVFQRPLLLNRTVRANVEYGLRLHAVRQRSSRVEKILEQLRLSELADRSANTLSGGETQLVTLARSLVLKPEVLLLDEPTSHLDPARVALVEAAVGELHRQRGTTVVWATHNLFQARRVANRVALLLDGRLVEVAGTEAFFDHPQNPRTAAFVRGDMVY